MGMIYQRGNIWWIKYYRNGKYYRESSKSNKKMVAKKLLDRLGWKTTDVDLWEVNEAFAVVPMAFMQELGIPREKLNVHEGACALGHPIGASGCRVLVTLLHEMIRQDKKIGVASLCLGGGEAVAMVVKR